MITFRLQRRGAQTRSLDRTEGTVSLPKIRDDAIPPNSVRDRFTHGLIAHSGELFINQPPDEPEKRRQDIWMYQRQNRGIKFTRNVLLGKSGSTSQSQHFVKSFSDPAVGKLSDTEITKQNSFLRESLPDKIPSDLSYSENESETFKLLGLPEDKSSLIRHNKYKRGRVLRRSNTQLPDVLGKKNLINNNEENVATSGYKIPIKDKENVTTRYRLKTLHSHDMRNDEDTSDADEKSLYNLDSVKQSMEETHNYFEPNLSRYKKPYRSIFDEDTQLFAQENIFSFSKNYVDKVNLNAKQVCNKKPRPKLYFPPVKMSTPRLTSMKPCPCCASQDNDAVNIHEPLEPKYLPSERTHFPSLYDSMPCNNMIQDAAKTIRKRIKHGYRVGQKYVFPPVIDTDSYDQFANTKHTDL